MTCTGNPVRFSGIANTCECYRPSVPSVPVDILTHLLTRPDSAFPVGAGKSKAGAPGLAPQSQSGDGRTCPPGRPGPAGRAGN